MSAAFPQVGTTLCVRLPCDTRKTFGLLARSRGMTPSGLLRSLIDQEIAGRPGTEPGEVEAAVRFELSGRVIDSARAATAVNVARRLDRNPASGAANANALVAVLDQLLPLEGEGIRPEVDAEICRLAAELGVLDSVPDDAA